MYDIESYKLMLLFKLLFINYKCFLNNFLFGCDGIIQVTRDQNSRLLNMVKNHHLRGKANTPGPAIT